MSTTTGWNRPRQGEAIKTVKKTSIYRWAMCGFVLLVAGVVAVCVLSEKPSETKDEEVQPKVTKKAPLKPQAKVADKVKVEEEKPKNLVKTWDGKMVEWPPKGAYKDEKGVWRHPGGQMCFDPRVKPHFIGTKTRQIFKSVSENQIASLLTARPGQQFFGTMTLYKSKKFKEDFVKALVSPTEIAEDDSEADKALKMDVRDTMKELAERIKGGENLDEILTEARQELQRLGQYKQDVVSELKSVMKGQTLTDEEVKTYVQAANKMLEDKGIAPLSVSDIAIRNLRHNVEMMALREKNTKEKE